MKSMLAVAQLISRQKLRKIDVLTEDVLNAKNSKFRDLYVGLRDGTIRSDREAAQKLYDADPSDARYRQLKSRFRKRLLNTLFFVDQSRPHRSSFDQTYHNCQRDWSLINILRVNGAEDPALQMAKSLLTVCQNYGFAELTVQTARYLANHAASVGDAKSGNCLEEIVAQANQNYQDELRSETCLRKARLLHHAASAELNSSEYEKEIGQLELEIDSFEEMPTSAVIFYNHLETKCLLARTLNERDEVVSLVDEAIAYSAVSPRQMQENRVWKLCVWQIEALIEQVDKQRGSEALHQLEARSKMGSEDWFSVQKLRLALLIRAGDLDRAMQVLKKVQSHRVFNRLPAQEAEVFRLLEMLCVCFEPNFNSNSGNVQKTKIEAFLRKDATFGGELQALNAWRYLIKATLLFKLGNQTELSETIADLRHLSVKRLDTKRDVRLIAVSQLLYRLERKHFKGSFDRVAERYFNQLQLTSAKCSLRAEGFNPIDVEDLLAFFGVNEFTALPA